MAIKSTTLSVGLITAPIRLEKAKADREVGFKMGSPAGNPVKQVYIDSVTGEIVGTSAECPRGVFDGDKFVEVPADARKAIDESFKIESLVVDSFIPFADVPWERAEGCYTIVPGKDAGTAGTGALALVQRGLEATGRAGIGKLTLRTKQRPFVVYARNGALVVNVLGFADAYTQLESAGDAYETVEVSDKTMMLFKTLVEASSAPASKLNEYADEVTPAREELIAQAVAGKTIDVPAAAPAAAPVADLESLLLASIGNTEAAQAPAKKAKTKQAA